ncbi:hypothetical protein [Anaerovibrio sp.]|uniref:hypothetical protein n=1 Tax=Anaerovibrio sp. TaxID=1872532 RepID=UPI003F1355D1
MQKEEIREIARTAALEAVKKSAEARDDIIREELDSRYHDVKLLMSNYRKLKLHYSSMADEALEVSSLCSLKHKTGLMMEHVDIMLRAYKSLCEASDNPDEIRRYNALYMRYVSDEKCKVADIAARLGIDRRTFFRDVSRAMEELSVLLFGLEAIGTWNPKK